MAPDLILAYCLEHLTVSYDTKSRRGTRREQTSADTCGN